VNVFIRFVPFSPGSLKNAGAKGRVKWSPLLHYRIANRAVNRKTRACPGVLELTRKRRQVHGKIRLRRSDIEADTHAQSPASLEAELPLRAGGSQEICHIATPKRRQLGTAAGDKRFAGIWEYWEKAARRNSRNARRVPRPMP
jgi:hypothetical protein